MCSQFTYSVAYIWKAQDNADILKKTDYSFPHSGAYVEE